MAPCLPAEIVRSAGGPTWNSGRPLFGRHTVRPISGEMWLEACKDIMSGVPEELLPF